MILYCGLKYLSMYIYIYIYIYTQLDHCEESLEDSTEFRSIVAGHLLYDEEKAPIEAIRVLINKCLKGRKRRPTMDEVWV